MRHREVDLCLSINCKSILFIPFPSCLRADVSYFLCCTRKREPSGTPEHDWRRRYADVPFPRATKEIGNVSTQASSVSLLELEQLGMSRVLRNEKVNAISTLVIRTRFARSTKTYTTFTSFQNAACSNTFFFFWRVDYALEGSMF